MFKKKSGQDVLVEESPDIGPAEKLVGADGSIADIVVHPNGLQPHGEPALPPARYVEDKGSGMATIELGGAPVEGQELAPNDPMRMWGHKFEGPAVEAERASKRAGGGQSFPAAPAPQTPSVGRVVHYKLRVRDVMAIRDARLPGLVPGAEHQEGQVLPAMIVKVTEAPSATNAGACSLKVMVDAALPDMWLQSVTRGDSNGQWNWPPRV